MRKFIILCALCALSVGNAYSWNQQDVNVVNNNPTLVNHVDVNNRPVFAPTNVMDTHFNFNGSMTQHQHQEQRQLQQQEALSISGVNIAPNGITATGGTATIMPGAAQGGKASATASIGDGAIRVGVSTPVSINTPRNQRITPMPYYSAPATLIPGTDQRDVASANVVSFDRQMMLMQVCPSGTAGDSLRPKVFGPYRFGLMRTDAYFRMKNGSDAPQAYPLHVPPQGTGENIDRVCLGTLVITVDAGLEATAISPTMLEPKIRDYICDNFPGAGRIGYVLYRPDFTVTPATVVTGDADTKGVNGGVSLPFVAASGNVASTKTTVVTAPIKTTGAFVAIVSLEDPKDNRTFVLRDIYTPLTTTVATPPASGTTVAK